MDKTHPAYYHSDEYSDESSGEEWEWDEEAEAEKARDSLAATLKWANSLANGIGYIVSDEVSEGREDIAQPDK